MKRILVLILCFSLCLALLSPLCLTARAGYSYQDQFTALTDSEEKAYQGLAYRLVSSDPEIAFAGFSDGAVTAREYTASATYRLSGATSVRLGVYTRYGTFLHMDPLWNAWVLGVGSYGDKRYEGKVPPALLDAPRPFIGTGPDGKRGLYAKVGDDYYRMFWDEIMNYPQFFPSEAQPYRPTEIKLYGINVYADGQPISLNRVNATYHKAQSKLYEEFTAPIPAGTASIQVEINDVPVYPYRSGKDIPNPISWTGGVSAVTLDGGSLLPPGEPAKEPPKAPVEEPAPEPVQGEDEIGEPEPDDDDDEDERDSRSVSRAAAAVNRAADVVSRAADAVSRAAGAISSEAQKKTEEEAFTVPGASLSEDAPPPLKFEGSPLPLSASQPAPPLPEESGAAASSQRIADDAAALAGAPVTEVYQVEKSGRDSDAYLTAAAVYVTLCAAALLAVILRGGKKGS